MDRRVLRAYFTPASHAPLDVTAVPSRVLYFMATDGRFSLSTREMTHLMFEIMKRDEKAKRRPVGPATGPRPPPLLNSVESLTLRTMYKTKLEKDKVKMEAELNTRRLTWYHPWPAVPTEPAPAWQAPDQESGPTKSIRLVISSYFTDRMVIQKGAEWCVWGWSTPPGSQHILQLSVTLRATHRIQRHGSFRVDSQASSLPLSPTLGPISTPVSIPRPDPYPCPHP